ncbi:hypothetical protein MTO96_037356 [Rhipicephalus appendiculatus]
MQALQRRSCYVRLQGECVCVPCRACSSFPTQDVSSAADSQEAPITDAEGLPLPEEEPASEVASGRSKEGPESELAEASPSPAIEMQLWKKSCQPLKT